MHHGAFHRVIRGSSRTIVPDRDAPVARRAADVVARLLQVAAAAHLARDTRLRDHAIRNFIDRLETGTLEEPSLAA